MAIEPLLEKLARELPECFFRTYADDIGGVVEHSSSDLPRIIDIFEEFGLISYKLLYEQILEAIGDRQALISTTYSLLLFFFNLLIGLLIKSEPLFSESGPSLCF